MSRVGHWLRLFTRHGRRHLPAHVSERALIYFLLAAVAARVFHLDGLLVVGAMLAFVAASALAVVNQRAAVRQRRRAAGLCPVCAYDLRATPGRCPDCGAVCRAADDAAATVGDA